MTIQFQESGIPQSEDFNVSETRSERILGYALCARAPPSVPVLGSNLSTELRTFEARGGMDGEPFLGITGRSWGKSTNGDL